MNGGWGISYDIALRWMALDLTDDKSTLVQVMAWCCQATSHYLSQCWPRSMSQNGVTRPQWVKWLWALCLDELTYINDFAFEFCNLLIEGLDLLLSVGIRQLDFVLRQHDMRRQAEQVLVQVHLEWKHHEAINRINVDLCDIQTQFLRKYFRYQLIKWVLKNTIDHIDTVCITKLRYQIGTSTSEGT